MEQAVIAIAAIAAGAIFAAWRIATTSLSLRTLELKISRERLRLDARLQDERERDKEWVRSQSHQGDLQVDAPAATPDWAWKPPARMSLAEELAQQNEEGDAVGTDD